MNLSPRARRLVARQKVKYLQSLPEKRSRIARCWREIQGQGWTPDLSDKLRTEVHRLSGSAGSYGLAALGQAAQDLDVLLAGDMAINSSGIPAGSGFNELMETLLSSIELAIEKKER